MQDQDTRRSGPRLELERSLERPKTDPFDLCQVRHICTLDGTKEALGPTGAIEVFLKAKEPGRVQYLGFSTHKTKGALAVLSRFRFNAAVFPINSIEFLEMGFGEAVLSRSRGASIS